MRAEGGCTWGDFNHATYAVRRGDDGRHHLDDGHRRASRWAAASATSRAGYGLSIDNLLSADVVTADGSFKVASEKQNPDLFWALRGGGGNFGVVTSFEYQLHPVKDIFVGLFFFELSATPADPRVLPRLHREGAGADGGVPAFQIAPPLPFIPEKRTARRSALDGRVLGRGRSSRASKALEPIRKAGPIAAELVTPMPFPALNSAFDALLPPGLQHYWKATFASELTDGAIAAHLQHGPKVPVVNSTMHIYPINGACNRVKADATAFAYRDAQVRDGDRRHVARRRATTRRTPTGSRTTTRRCSRTRPPAATSTSWPTTTRAASATTTRATTTACGDQEEVRPLATCST